MLKNHSLVWLLILILIGWGGNEYSVVYADEADEAPPVNAVATNQSTSTTGNGGEDVFLLSTANAVSDVLVEDFTDMVTKMDGGYNGFSGNAGDINKNGEAYIHCETLTTATESYGQGCHWDFTITNDREAYAGLFFCIFGLCDTKATFNGNTFEGDAEKIYFTEHSLNLDGIDGIVNEPGGPRKITALGITIDYHETTPLKLRVEIKDSSGGMRFKRFLINQPITFTWNFREDYDGIGNRDLDIHQAKVLSLIIERENIADGIQNPLTGQLDLKRIWFVPERAEIKPDKNADLLDLLERRAFQYFIDWSSLKKALPDHPDRSSFGIPQDRSSSGDLLTVGGIGFALPAYIIGAERGWISRTEAISRTLAVLRNLSDSNAFGFERTDRIGYKGWFYHFLGVDGRRKLNFDFTATPVDESKNTVELSTIDTGLALMGVLAAQSYFTGDNADEQAIHELAQTIYDNVDWSFMLEPQSRQFYLGWKPEEVREGDPYEIPDAEVKGKYLGTIQNPSTLNYYTDEALIVNLLAAGSTTHPIPPKIVYCALLRTRKSNGPILSYPGALFTYQFLQAFLDTRMAIFPRCPGEQSPVNWFENSRQVIHNVIDYAKTDSRYGPGAWGISAAEGPDDLYHAYGALPVAINLLPEGDGTVTYYGMVSSMGFTKGDNDLYSAILQGIDDAWNQGHWHYRFALPDAYNKNIKLSPSPEWLRTQGKWVQRALFAIDQGPMLLHLENSRSGLIWDLLAGNPNIQRAVDRLRGDKPILLAPIGTISTTTPTYRWQAVADATWYYLWVNDASGNRIRQWYTADQVGCASGEGECAVIPTVALQAGAGQWWIQPYSASGYGSWSGCMLGYAMPTYRWQAVLSATWYYLWVNDASGHRIDHWYTAALAGCEGGSGMCALQPPISLQLGAGQWWVQAYGPGGYSPWSDAMSFTVEPAPVLIAPTGTINNPTPTYRWQAVANATWYYLWVNDASGNRILHWYTAVQTGCEGGSGECAVTPTVALQAGAGQWWVQAYGAGGYGPWSQGLSFFLQ